jgi:hypothetical protein
MHLLKLAISLKGILQCTDPAKRRKALRRSEKLHGYKFVGSFRIDGRFMPRSSKQGCFGSQRLTDKLTPNEGFKGELQGKKRPVQK